jgi:hypothetical protein
VRARDWDGLGRSCLLFIFNNGVLCQGEKDQGEAKLSVGVGVSVQVGKG